MSGPGYPILNPEGKEIKIPAYLFPILKKLGVVYRNRQTGGLQIKKAIYSLLKPEFDPLTESPKGHPQRRKAYSPSWGAVSSRRDSFRYGLRQILGPDCSGSKIVDCDCPSCRPHDTGSDDSMGKLIEQVRFDINRRKNKPDSNPSHD